MSTVIVGVADCKIGNQPEDTLVTYALGSCIAVVLYDPVARVGGMLHLMLPDSSLDQSKAERNPYMFADTGIPLLFRSAYGQGAEKKRLNVWLAGGAQVVESTMFDIGKRNYLAARKILWKAGVLVQAEATGGTTSRTIRLELETGNLWLRGAGEPERLLGSSKVRSVTCP